MKCITIFDEERDIQRTREGLNIDLSTALREGVVQDSGTEPEYNNLDDPSKIRGRVNNVFDAISERNSALHKAVAPAPAPAPKEEE